MGWAAAIPAIASGVSSLFNMFSSKNEARHQERVQREFAQNAIQWRAADAKKAGIHPLYALGAPTMSYSPVSIGGAESMPDMGQDITRAMEAGMPREGQVTAYERAVQDLTLKKFGLENELLAAQTARIKNEILQKPALPPVTLPSGAGRLIPGQSSTAQSVQDQYGDVIENIYGIWRLGQDAYDTWLKPRTPARRSTGPKSQGGYMYGKTGRR